MDKINALICAKLQIKAFFYPERKKSKIYEEFIMSDQPFPYFAIKLVKDDLNDIIMYYEHPTNFINHEKIHGTQHRVIALADKYLQVAINATAAIYDLYSELVIHGCKQKEYAETLGFDINRVHRTYKKMLLLFAYAFYGPDINPPQQQAS